MKRNLFFLLPPLGQYFDCYVLSQGSATHDSWYGVVCVPKENFLSENGQGL